MNRPRARTALLAALSFLAGCGGTSVLKDSGVAPVPTASDGGLPGQRGATAGRFTTHDRCTMVEEKNSNAVRRSSIAELWCPPPEVNENHLYAK
jgi:hypothetical protein